MEIVAFVANYDETNCTNCTVYNAEGCALEGNDMVDGISTPEVLPLLRYRPCTTCRALVLARCAVASTL